MTRGRKLYDEHMKYVAARDMIGMVTNTYADDAVYYHNLPFFEDEPPYIVRGKDAIISALTTIAERQGDFRVEEPYDWSDSDEHVCFQCILRSPNTGTWLLDEFWLLEGDKVAHCFGYGYNLGQ